MKKVCFVSGTTGQYFRVMIFTVHRCFGYSSWVCYNGGKCVSGGCHCPDEYTGRRCTIYKLKKKPLIHQVQARLSHWPRTGPMAGKENYSILAEASHQRTQEDTTFIWSNRKDFNRLTTTASCEYLPEALGRNVVQPGEVASANVNILLTKQPPASYAARRVNRVISKNYTRPCPLSPTGGETGFYACTVDEKNFNLNIETGDILKVTFTTASRDRTVRNQQFQGPSSSLSVEFRFDFDRPEHCHGDETMLNVSDVTEVFPLSKAANNQLEIRQPLKPIFGPIEINHSRLPVSVNYTPPEAGMYAVILEATDRANNSQYVRRLVLYDPTSRVTSDPDRRFYVSSACPNTLHEEEGLLGEVREFPVRLEGSIRAIRRNSDMDDHEGKRTVEAIPNVKGIVNFQVAYSKHRDSGKQEEPQESDWKNVGLSQTYTLPEAVSTLACGGDTVTLWVRASDVMGNQMEETTQVTFDETPPEVELPELEMNAPVSGVPFSSVFHFHTRDVESGIAFVNWTFTRSNGNVLYQEKVQPKLTKDCPPGNFRTCYCTRQRNSKCFLVDQSYALNNCHVTVEKEKLSTEQITVKWEVFNMAGLVSSGTMLKGDLTALNGTEEYFPPQNVRSESITTNGVSLMWTHPPSCFRRTAIWVTVTDDDGNEFKRKVHTEATQFDLTGLEPGTQYTAHLTTNYDGQMSESQSFVFSTVEENGLGDGAIAGIVIGLLVLVVAIAALVLMSRSQRVRDTVRSVRPGSAKFSSSMKQDLVEICVRTTHVDNRQEGIDNHAAVLDDNDDSYLYLQGSQSWDLPAEWRVERRQLTLLDQIGNGRFAEIFKASLKTSDPDSQDLTVAAKILKANFNENDANRMMVKIRFFATRLGYHDNVLRFHGAVLDNVPLGPTMLVEYCECGQLDKWLQNLDGITAGDKMDTLCRFALEIIVHERLAARNVLLTLDLRVKLAGLGPQEEKGKDTPIPVKWTAPEILEGKAANEQSDVWSYGVTLWEIFSLGKLPYPGVRPADVGVYLKSGNRMKKPELADDLFYKLMQDCWQDNPRSRPRFMQISRQLAGLYRSAATQPESESVVYANGKDD
ncbi:hypothetical protein BaRGS_00010958 [Batillaria attramentaria]|uniref:Receptor protein-tyrosine kinase n=1 Tax=Batillaria attramentaria TaxID=370345 RepID=A0ABD0LED0_9CAEN